MDKPEKEFPKLSVSHFESDTDGRRWERVQGVEGSRGKIDDLERSRSQEMIRQFNWFGWPGEIRYARSYRVPGEMMVLASRFHGIKNSRAKVCWLNWLTG